MDSDEETSIKKTHNCNKCKKPFRDAYELRRHLNRKVPCVPNSVPVIENNNPNNACKFCGKTYSSVYSLKRHQKDCNMTKNPQLMIDLVLRQEERISQLEAQIAGKVVEAPHQTVVNNNLTVNNVQQNMYVNVTICDFGKEDLSKLNQQDVINLLKGPAEDFMTRMIDYIHANPKYPEFHNAFYDSDRKVALVYKQIQGQPSTWVCEDIEQISKQMTDKIKNHIQPLNSPYFNTLAQAKDTETANKIPQILCDKWNTPETVEGTIESLSKVTKNEGFMDRVQELDVE